MRICRFDGDRLGIATDGAIADVTAALRCLPDLRWPLAAGDHAIRHFSMLLNEMKLNLPTAVRKPLGEARLLSPVANPGKVIAAPLNYIKHVDEVRTDSQIHAGTHTTAFDGFATPIDKLGLFLKASSSVVGPSQGVRLPFPDRRSDHEVELVVVIGREAKDLKEENALDVVAGYCVGLDMTVRGPEDRSFRKSPDSFTVLGPWLVTPDEIDDPGSLDLSISVNGKVKQSGNTRDLTVGVRSLIARASSWYTLHPGDVLMTGTPDGVAEVQAGDAMTAQIQGIGSMTVAVS